jgi:hypothetical protein
LCDKRAAKCVGWDEVGEPRSARDLDDREQLPEARLELLVAGDVDLDELERLLLPHGDEDGTRAVAKVAAGRVVEGDTRTRHARVIAASALGGAAGAGYEVGHDAL